MIIQGDVPLFIKWGDGYVDTGKKVADFDQMELDLIDLKSKLDQKEKELTEKEKEFDNFKNKHHAAIQFGQAIGIMITKRKSINP